MGQRTERPTDVRQAQVAWARARGLDPDARGYVGSVELNLRVPLSASVRAAYNQARGSELTDRGSVPPAKMRALHSSAALVVNAFAHWADRAPGPLLRALEIPFDKTASVALESPLPTRAGGIAPHLDVLISSGQCLVGIESKFTEWMKERRADGTEFRPSYFPGDGSLWGDAGLPRSHQLALELRAGARAFRHLDVPQLLKHALGLRDASLHNQQEFRLLYLFVDWDCSARPAHAKEIAEFERLVGSELGFRAMTYQQLFEYLARTIDEEDAVYLEYLRERYTGRGTCGTRSGVIT